MTEPQSNPIIRRMSILHDQWAAFTQNPDARLLYWQVDEDEISMIEGFFALEADPGASETSDLLLIADVPFADSNSHGMNLRNWLCASYEADKKDLTEAGVDANWRCPSVRKGKDDVQAWVEALGSFHKAHGGEGDEIVAVWLRPREVSNSQGYIPWLQRLIHATPSTVRFVVTDDRFGDELEALAEQEPTGVFEQVANLNMAAALEEIASDPNIPPGPGTDFRLLFIRAGNAAKQENLAEAESLGVQAVNLAKGQGWHSLASAAQFLLASMALQGKDPKEASRRFLSAEESAKEAEKAGMPEGKSLRLQARMASGSALLSANDFQGARKLFQTCVPLAKEAQDLRSELDAWRLTSYCHEQNQEWQPAWDTGLEGFKVAQKMDEETRNSSTVKFLCESLLRLTEKSSFLPRKPQVEKHIVTLLGPHWRKDARNA